MVTFPLLLLQVPPAGVEFNVVVTPIHADDAPVIAEGLAFMVTVVVVLQPVLNV